MKRLTLSLLSLLACFSTGCPNQETPLTDAGVRDSGSSNPQLVIEPDPTTLTILEGGGPVGFTVSLSEEPSRSIAIRMTTSDASVLAIEPSEASLDRTSFSAGVAVTLTPQDDEDTANEVVEIEIESEIGTARYTLTVFDDDAANVVVTPASVGLTEGSTAGLQVRLSARPAEEVRIALASADPTRLTLDTTSLAFDAESWQTPQTVTLTAAHDFDLSEDVVDVALSNPAGEGATVVVTITDDDAQGLVVSTSSLTIDEGAAEGFEVALAFQPGEDVTVAIGSSAPNVAAADRATLTFTSADWNVPQTVLVSGVDDPNVAIDTATISLTAAALGARADVLVTVVDDDTQIIEVTTTTISVGENASATFGVRLGFVPEGDVIVALAPSNTAAIDVSPTSLTFTPADWSVLQVVTVTGVDDDDVADETESIRLSAPEAGDVTVEVNVEDDDVLAIAVDAPSVSVMEGTTITFAVRLTAEPPGDVTVGGASALDFFGVDPPSLTFTPQNWNMPQLFLITGLEDPNLTDETDTLELMSPGLMTLLVPVTVLDDDVQSLVVSPLALSVLEGSSGDIAVRLAFEPSLDVTVTVGSQDASVAMPSSTMLTFTPADYATPQIVSIAALADADIQDEAVDVTVASAGLPSVTVAVTVVDDDVLNFNLNPTSLALTEGGAPGSFSVNLTQQPAGTLTVEISASSPADVTLSRSTLTFDAANWNMPQAVSVTPNHDQDVANESLTLTVSAPGVTPRAVTVTIADDDVQALVLTRNTVTVREGQTQTVGVSLAFDPGTSVTVMASSSLPALASAAPASLTFDSGNYSVPQNLTIGGVQDDNTANGTATVTVQTSVAPSQTIAVTVEDDDVQVITLNRTTLALTEGGNGTFTVQLGFNPLGPVTVSVATSNANVAAPSAMTLSFDQTSWSVPQTVTVTAPQDDDVQNGSATITLSSAVTANRTVAVTVTDDDTQAIVASVNGLTVAEGASGSFTVRLAFNPLAPVTVNVASADQGAASPAPTMLTFDAGNYSVPQAVTVMGVADDDTQNESVAVTLSGGGAPANTVVAVTVTDDDVQEVLVSQTSVTVGEGNSTSVTVSLAFNPVNPATITVASTDAGAATGTPASLSFNSANYAQPQTLTISGVEDLDLGDEAVTIRLTSTIANPVDIAVTVLDEDTQSLVVAPASLGVTEGTSEIFTVRLAFMPAANVGVAIASNDTAVATVSQASLTFTPANYDQPQPISVFGVQDVDLNDESTTVAVTSAGLPPESVAVNVADEDVQAFIINPTSLSIPENGQGTVTVRLAFLPNGPVTASILSADPGAVGMAQSTLVFDPSNYDVPQPIVLEGEPDADTRDENVTVTVSSADVPAPGTISVFVDDSDTQALVVTPASLSVDEEGAAGQFFVSFAFEPDGPTVVNVTSTDIGAVAVSPAALTFTPGNYTVPQPVAVTGVSDQDVVSEMVNVDVTTAIAPAELVVVTVMDDDTQAIVLSHSARTVNEGATSAFTVRLAFQPQSNTVVTLSSSDPGAAGVSPAFITFTSQNWATPVNAAVSGVQDQDQLDESATVTVSSPGLPDQTVAVTVLDDDDQAIIVSRNSVDIDEEQTDTFTVRLAFIPLSPMETVTITSSDLGAATAMPATIVFDASSYATPVAVTVRGETDEDVLDETVTLTLDSDGAATPNQMVTVNVNDIDVQQIIVSAATLSLTEGDAAGAVTLRLSHDPSGDQIVTVTSLDAGAVSGAPAQLTFNSGNYTSPQTVTISPVDDDDVRDETVDVQLTSPAVATEVVSVSVADDDTQAIITQNFPITVGEGSSDGVNVRLAFRPTNPITVSVTIGDPTLASATPASLTFDSTDFDQIQRVTVDGLQDADLDNESTTFTLSTGGTPPEGAPDVVLQLDIFDDDTQVIIAESIPTTLPTSVQEGGPGVAFQVRLGFPPRLSEGGTDTVVLTSPLPNVSLSPASLTFGQGDFDQPMTVTITATDDGDTVHDLIDVVLEIVGEVSATHSVQVIDDEQTVLATTTYPSLTGGTLFTKRQNVGWGASRLAVIGSDSTTGETRIASNTRELDDLVLGPAIAAGGGALGAESVEFDGTNFRFFASDSTAVRYAGSDETAAATFLSRNVVSNALNFWPAWNGTDAFGVVYRRDEAGADRLGFFVVQLDGTASAPTVLTISDNSDDLQPNAHFNGSGYTVVYSSASEVRCARTDASGVLILGSDRALTGFPAGGAFVSTAYDGSAILAAYYNATNSIDVVRIDPSNCTISGTHRALGGSNVFLSSPPAIAWNGTEIAVAYDYLDNGVERVGVLLAAPNLDFRSDYTAGPGSRPSITWAGDRWALRYGDPVVVTVGSFQSP